MHNPSFTFYLKFNCKNIVTINILNKSLRKQKVHSEETFLWYKLTLYLNFTLGPENNTSVKTWLTFYF